MSDCDANDTIRGLRAALRQMAAMRDHIAAERDEARAERDSMQADLARVGEWYSEAMKEIGKLTAERDAAAAHARHMQQALDNTFKDRDAAQGDADRLRRTLAVVLARFTEPGHLGAAGDCLRTGWVQAELVNEWRELVEATRD